MTRMVSITLTLAAALATAVGQAVEIRPQGKSREKSVVPSQPLAGRKLADWIKDLKDADVLVREEAVEVLGQAGNVARPAAAELQKLLAADNRNLRVRAALALVRIGAETRGVVEALAEGMKGASLATRREAVAALALVGIDAGVTAAILIDCLDDPDAALRGQAATALQGLGKAALPALFTRLESKNATVRQNVIVQLGTHMAHHLAREHAPALRGRLEDDTLRTRVEAARLLWGLGQTDASIVAALLEGVKGGDAGLQGSVLTALLDAPAKPKTILPVVEVSLKSSHASSRVLAARVFYAVEKRADRVLPLYLEVLNDNANRVNWTPAVTGLVELKADARPALPRLIEILKMRDHLGPYEIRTVLTHIGTPSVAPLIAALKENSGPNYWPGGEIVIGALGELGRPAARAILPLLNHADFNVRARAVRVVGGLGAEAGDAVPRLVELLRDDTPNVRDGAVQALGSVGPAARAATPKLVDMAGEGDLNIRLAALRALAQVGPAPAAVVPLCRPLLSDKHPALRQAGLDVILAVAPNHPCLLPTALAMLKDPDGRTGGLHIITRMGRAAARATPRVAELLADPNLQIRASAASALGAIGPPAKAATPALLEQLNQGDASLLASTAFALQRIKPEAKAAVPRLVDFIKVSRDTAAGTVAALLGEYGDQAAAAFPALLDVLRDTARQPVVRCNAAIALAKIDPARARKEALVDMHKLLSDNSLRLIVARAILLADGTDREALAAFDEALKNPNVYSRGSACQMLSEAGPSARKFLPALRAMRKDTPYYPRATAAFAAYRITNDPLEALPTLEALLRDATQQYSRGYAAYLLGEMGAPAKGNLAALKALRNDPDAYARTNAVMAVTKIEKASRGAGADRTAPKESPDED